ncbi:MAG: phosphoribosyltransferase [Proteobacteria bacterium]|nr:phosphoribosyltransferase [Pseudomonadota bacterium]
MFQDRQEAGQKLAQKLKPYQAENPLILALPRGGVPVGFEVAKTLKAPLDVLVVRKVGAPWNSELGVGAVAPGVQMLDEVSLHILDIKPASMKHIVDQEIQEMNRRLHLYRQDQAFPALTGRTVILIDDGLATGITTRAAIESVKKLNPAKVILAVPVGPAQTVRTLKKLVDKVVCLETPSPFYAVGSFYQNFMQVSDEEVISFLTQAAKILKSVK